MRPCEISVHRRPRAARRVGLAGIGLDSIREGFRIDPLVGEQAAGEDLPFGRAARALRSGSCIGDPEIADRAGPDRGKRLGIIEPAVITSAAATSAVASPRPPPKRSARAIDCCS